VALLYWSRDIVIEFKEIVETERGPTGRILREKLSCGHWVETAKRGLQVMNLKTKEPITKRTCKECPAVVAPEKPAASKSAKSPAKRSPPAASKSASTAPATPHSKKPKVSLGPNESARVACRGCEGIFVCWAGCPVQRYGTFRAQELREAAGKKSAPLLPVEVTQAAM
jgi:RNase P subunit RPR2